MNKPHHSTIHHEPNAFQDSKLAWLVCLTSGLFFFYEFIQLNMFNTLEPFLMRDFHINAEQVASISSMYFYAQVIFLFPSGLMLDRFSIKKLILGSLIICILGTTGIALSTSTLICSLCRFLEGVGAALCFLSSIKLTSRWFTPKHLALVTGLIVTMAMTGGLIAQTPLAFLVEHLGWRHALFVNISGGAVIFMMIALIVKDYPPGTQQEVLNQQHKLHDIGFWHSIFLVMKNKQNWLSGLYTCLINLPILVLGALFGSLYLMQVRHLNMIDASFVSSLLFLGCIIGSPTAGYISDKLGVRKSPMIIGAILSIAVMLFIIYWPGLSFEALAILFFILGFITSTQVLTYPLITESNSRTLTGSASGVASVIIMSGGAIFQPVFGWLLQMHWNGIHIKGVPVYSAHDFYRAMLVLPAAFLVSLAASFLLKETFCENNHTDELVD